MREQGQRCLDFKTDKNRYICALYARIDSLAEETLKLLKGNSGTGAPVLLRSAYEAYVDLVCIAKDEDHVEDMKLRFYSQEKRFYKNYSSDNHYMANVTEEEARRKVEHFEGLLKNKSPLNLRDKFKKAGELKEYYTVYHVLSGSSHASIESIAEFFSENREVLFGRSVDDGLYNFYCLSAINLACAALMYTLDSQNTGEQLVNELRENIQRAMKTAEATV
nr:MULTISPECIES: DUF5677 domain-containing protein [Chromohalobacter]